MQSEWPVITGAEKDFASVIWWFWWADRKVVPAIKNLMQQFPEVLPRDPPWHGVILDN